MGESLNSQTSESQPRVAVVGAGAVGSYFGGMLARSGVRVTLIGRRAHVEAIQRDGLFVDSINFQERIRVAASADLSAARGAAFVLFCVKTTDTETTARQLVPHLAAGAAVFSLQNGVDNVARIRAAAGFDSFATVVYVAAALPSPGRMKHSGGGRLILGPGPQAEKLSQLFASAGVPCQLSENIEGELWKKLVLNCAGNAVTAIGHASYAAIARHPPTREVLLVTAREVAAVARAAGVLLPDEDFGAQALKFCENVGDATSSTAQDIQRGKRTEIDSLNGYVARRGAELGVPTPVNHTLWALVKLMEEAVKSPA
jgi:2-dehydropantoate 2-reductase